ncbi:MAG: RCC1 domain-containing protein [Actinomycetota bacterium]
MRKWTTVLLASLLASFVMAAPSHAATQGSGKIFDWGSNQYGQLGNGSVTGTTTPSSNGLNKVTAAAGGWYHSLALRSDGTVVASGLNSSGQLGNGSTANSTSPVQVSGLASVTAISAGQSHSLALRSDGTVMSWGGNSFGQLGNSVTTNSSIPVKVSGLSNVTAIAAGYGHSLALRSDGTVWAWGWGSYGQLGNGDTTGANSSVPVQVTGVSRITAIAAGFQHSLALSSDGTVWGWGDNNSGELGTTGNNFYSPIQIPGLTGVTAIAAGGGLSAALRNDGTVWVLGDNTRGQFGNGSFGFSSGIPVQSNGLSGITSIAAGQGSLYALRNDGALFAWGYNADGELGDRTSNDSHVPEQIQSMPGISSIAAGAFDALAVVIPSNACDNGTQVIDGTATVPGTLPVYTKLYLEQPDSQTVWICFRVVQGTTFEGGLVSVVAGSIAGIGVTPSMKDACASTPVLDESIAGQHITLAVDDGSPISVCTLANGAWTTISVALNLSSILPSVNYTSDN